MGALYVNSSESKMNMEHTLLIVEDDCDTSEMLRVYFEAQGYRVITAASGGEALEKGRQQLPDLILLDIRLPDIDGFEVGKQLQDDLRTSRLPVIFVTERRERDDRIMGLKLGAIDYITKPFDVQELRRNSDCACAMLSGGLAVRTMLSQACLAKSSQRTG